MFTLILISFIPQTITEHYVSLLSHGEEGQRHVFHQNACKKLLTQCRQHECMSEALIQSCKKGTSKMRYAHPDGR